MQIKKAIKKGFTLVELVVVIAVIAILAATSVGVYFGMLESANRSADEAAVTQMNKILVMEGVLDDVDNILDVHEAFSKNGLSTKSYTALAKDHRFYFDNSHDVKKILYVNEATGAVEYPEEEAGKDHSSCELLSLNMELTAKEPTTLEVSSEFVKATVTSAEEYAYVVKEYEKDRNKSLTLTIDGGDDGILDLKGANIAIPNAVGHVIIQSANDSPVTLKNISCNAASFTSLGKTYAAAGLISSVGDHKAGLTGSAEIKNIIVENAAIRDDNTSGVAAIIGGVYNVGAVTLDNVFVKDSTIIGHRNVGAIIGYNAGTTIQLKNTISVDNTHVKVVAGRSGLVFGCMNKFGKGTNLTLACTNSTYGKADNWVESEEYPYIENSLAYNHGASPKVAITTIEELRAKFN